MQTTSGRKLLTCRYWAFGPRCPNIDENGVDVCPYAHWDTGRLSHFYEQRGTCWYWTTNRGCYWGLACNFEHRHTGYMGVHHGSKSPYHCLVADLRVVIVHWGSPGRQSFDLCQELHFLITCSQDSISLD